MSPPAANSAIDARTWGSWSSPSASQASSAKLVTCFIIKYYRTSSGPVKAGRYPGRRPPSAPDRPSADRQVILGVGEGSDAGAAHVAFALQEAHARGCDLVAVHARSRQETRQKPPGLDSPAVDTLLGAALPDRAAFESGVIVHRQVVDGPAPHVLTQAAHNADLLVLGVRHVHGMVRRELRPTHHAALRHSPCPVALVGSPWPSPRRPGAIDVG
ncbi:universal stress protein [Streptomyces anthocyanicus]|uniref:universal stress protein n=1 Tax=Streptomyces anthocyanicus TaxID=68174 RepID=UPI00386F9F75